MHLQFVRTRGERGRGGDAEEEEEEDETRAEVVLIDARSLTSLAIQIHAGVLHRCR